MTRKTKTELIAAVSMLLVAAVMLSSASFAWMTISQAPEVSNLTVSMGVTANLEIAKASSGAVGEVPEVTDNDYTIGETTWGSKVTSFTAANGINWPTEVTNGGIYTVAFAADGRTNGVTQSLSPTPGTMTNGCISYTAAIDTGAGNSITRTIQAGYGVWLRSNQDLTSVKAISSGTAIVTGGSGNAKADVSIKVGNGNPMKLGDDCIFSLSANEPVLVTILIGVSGADLIAKDFTRGNGATISNINIQFSAPEEILNGDLI